MTRPRGLGPQVEIQLSMSRRLHPLVHLPGMRAVGEPLYYRLFERLHQMHPQLLFFRQWFTGLPTRLGPPLGVRVPESYTGSQGISVILRWVLIDFYQDERVTFGPDFRVFPS